MNKITVEILDKIIAETIKIHPKIKIVVHARLFMHLWSDPIFKKNYERVGYEKVNNRTEPIDTYKGIRLFVSLDDYLVGNKEYADFIVPKTTNDGIVDYSRVISCKEFYGFVVPETIEINNSIVNYPKLVTRGE